MGTEPLYEIDDLVALVEEDWNSKLITFLKGRNLYNLQFNYTSGLIRNHLLEFKSTSASKVIGIRKKLNRRISSNGSGITEINQEGGFEYLLDREITYNPDKWLLEESICLVDRKIIQLGEYYDILSETLLGALNEDFVVKVKEEENDTGEIVLDIE